MALIDITRYTNSDDFGQTELDNICNEIEEFFNTTKISDQNLQDNSLSGQKLTTGSIVASKLTTNSITTNSFQDGSITPEKINADTAGAGITQETDGSLAANPDDTGLEISSDVIRLKDDGVTTAKLAANSASENTLADNAINSDKFSTTVNLQTSSTTGTSLSDSITLTRNAVLVVASYNISEYVPPLSVTQVTLEENGVEIANSRNGTFQHRVGGTFVIVRTPGTGSNTYEIKSSVSQPLAIQLFEL